MNKALVTLRCEYCGQEKTVWEGGEIGRCAGCSASVWGEDNNKRIDVCEKSYNAHNANTYWSSTGCEPLLSSGSSFSTIRYY